MIIKIIKNQRRKFLALNIKNQRKSYSFSANLWSKILALFIFYMCWDGCENIIPQWITHPERRIRIVIMMPQMIFLQKPPHLSFHFKMVRCIVNRIITYISEHKSRKKRRIIFRKTVIKNSIKNNSERNADE